MNHAGTVSKGNIRIACHIVCFFMLLFAQVHRIVKQRFIFFMLQILTRIAFQHFISRNTFFFIRQFAKHRIQQRFRHIINMAVTSFHLRIGFIRIDTKRHIGRQRPWCCRPCQNICFFPFYFKTGNSRTFLHIFISLGNFMGRKRRSAPGAIRNNLKTFI